MLRFVFGRKGRVLGKEAPVNPALEEFNANALIERCTEAHYCDREAVIIEPNRMVLGWTVEKIKLPYRSRIGARVEGKSSLARIGLGIHVTAPTIHPGFGVDPLKPKYPGSPIRLEIWNCGSLRIRLTKGLAICQLIFEYVDGTPEEGYAGQHAVQGPPTAQRSRRRPSG
jgi:dCTP deaminase